MGTTAEKGQRVLQSIAEVQQGINNLGGSLTDQTLFKNFRAELDNIYNNLPKTDYAEGSNITLSNTLKGKLDFDNDIVGYGQTSQYTTTGIQLLPIKEISERTDNGITYSVKNGIMRLNGTATGGFNIYLVGSYSQGDLSLESGDYTFAGQLISGSRVSGVCGKYVKDNANNTNIIDGNQIETLVRQTLTEDYSGLSVYLYISNGTVLNNLVIGLSLYKGSYTSQTIPTWERYTGGYASPSPNWKQQVKCVAGRNILNPELLYVFGSNKFISTQNYNTKGTIEVQPLTTYTISFDRFQGDGKIYEYNESDTQQNTINLYPSATPKYLTFTTTANTHKLGFYACIDNNGGVTIENAKPMLCEGAEHRAYLPYNTIEVVERGKNYFDKDTFVLNSAYSGNVGDTISISSNNATTRYPIFDISSEKITISATDTAVTFRVLLLDNNNKVLSNTGYTSLPQTINTSNASKVAIYFDKSTIDFSTANFQIETGSTASTYEPYKTPHSYQLSLGDKELYEDSTIVRNIDGSWKFVDNWYRLSSSEFSNLTISTSGSNKQFVVTKSNFIGVPTPKPGKIYCTHLKYNSSVWYTEGYCGIVSPGATLWMQMTQAFESVDAFKTFITTNNMEIVYQTEQPIETSITDTTLVNQLNAWYYSHSFTGTTIIEIDGQLPLIIKVRALKG